MTNLGDKKTYSLCWSISWFCLLRDHVSTSNFQCKWKILLKLKIWLRLHEAGIFTWLLRIWIRPRLWIWLRHHEAGILTWLLRVWIRPWLWIWLWLRINEARIFSWLLWIRLCTWLRLRVWLLVNEMNLPHIHPLCFFFQLNVKKIVFSSRSKPFFVSFKVKPCQLL